MLTNDKIKIAENIRGSVTFYVCILFELNVFCARRKFGGMVFHANSSQRRARSI